MQWRAHSSIFAILSCGSFGTVTLRVQCDLTADDIERADIKRLNRHKLAVGAWHRRRTSPAARYTYRIRGLLRPVLGYGLDAVVTPADLRGFDNAVEDDAERREEVRALRLRDSSARKHTTVRKRREFWSARCSIAWAAAPGFAPDR